MIYEILHENILLHFCFRDDYFKSKNIERKEGEKVKKE